MLDTSDRSSSITTGTSLLEQVSNIVNSSQERPSWDEYFMSAAILISSRSSCSRLHVGCLIVSQAEHKNRIIAAGYNGFLSGLPHKSRVREGHELGTVHAEQNALTDAARRGISVNNSTAYITHFPCIHCAKMLISSGISNIKYHQDYKNDSLVYEILVEANICIEKL